MTLVIEKPNTKQIEALTSEFYTLLFDDLLTEHRYDQIIDQLATTDFMPDVLLGMIGQGEPVWQEKHIRRFNIQIAM